MYEYPFTGNSVVYRRKKTSVLLRKWYLWT